MPYTRRLRSQWNVSAACCLSIVLFPIVGCGKIEFSPNELASAGYLQSTDPVEVRPAAEQASQVIEELFGTPDVPKWPEGVENFLRWDDVERSAGPVGRAHDRVERGLYRKHCVQCHGISGDGSGPAAMVLAPYARDFRRGTFKFKSTPIGSKPTREDVVRIIEQGIPGTSMPGFSPLKNREEFKHDIEAVSEYVIYLSIRGEVERRLLRAHAIDGEEISPELAVESAKIVTQQWRNAAGEVPAPIPVPELAGEELAESIARGHELFKSDKTACYKCHGPDADGNGVSHDYDEWTKDWTIRAGIDPSDRQEWRAMKPFGARKPVLNRSRDLLLGALRGGASTEQIARRIQLGIDGTPMPSATIALEGSPTPPPVGITIEEFQDLVRFVRKTAGLTETAEQVTK